MAKWCLIQVQQVRTPPPCDQRNVIYHYWQRTSAQSLFLTQEVCLKAFLHNIISCASRITVTIDRNCWLIDYNVQPRVN